MLSSPLDQESPESPGVVEYLPATQFWQVLAREAPTVGEYLQATQSWQVLATEAPTVGEHLPATHRSHWFHVLVINEFNTPARKHTKSSPERTSTILMYRAYTGALKRNVLSTSYMAFEATWSRTHCSGSRRGSRRSCLQL